MDTFQILIDLGLELLDIKSSKKWKKKSIKEKISMYMPIQLMDSFDK